MGAVFKIFKPVILLGIAIVLFFSGFVSAGSDLHAQLAAVRSPLDPGSLKTVLPTFGSALTALLSVWGLLSKTASPDDVAAIGKQVTAVHDATLEARVITQGESAKTRGVVKDGNDALLARLDQLEDKLSPDEIRDLESAIADIMASKDARKAPATAFLQEGDIEAAGDHLVKVAHQEGAAADDIDKSARETYREAGALFYPTNIAKALDAYRNCVARGSTRVWDYIYLSRLCERGGELTEAQDVLAKGQGLNPSNRNRMVLYNESGNVATAQGDLAAARIYYDDGLTLARTLTKADPSNTEFQRDLSVSYEKLGNVAVAQGDLTAARTYYDDDLIIAHALAKADPSNTGFQRDLSVSYNKLGNVATAQGDLPAARTYYDDGLTLRRALAKADPSNTGFQRDLSVSYNKLGNVATAQGDLPAARTYYDDGLTLTRTLAKADPSNTGFQRDLSVSYNKLGDIATAQGDLTAARTYYDDGLTLRRALAKADPSNTGFQRDLSVSIEKLGDVAVAQGDLTAARTYYDDGLTLRRALAKADPSNAEHQRDLSFSYDRLGDVAAAQGDLTAAHTYYDDGLTLRHTLTKADPSNAKYQRGLIVSYAKLASLGGDEALDHWRAAREIVSKLKAEEKLRPVDAWMPTRIDAEIAKLEG